MNLSKFNHISKKIWRQNLILIPIPEKQSSIKHTVDIGICFDNNSRLPFNLDCEQTIFPELIAADGQLQPILAINRLNIKVQTNWFAKTYLQVTRFFHKNDCYLIPGRDSIATSVNTKIFWQENTLNLEFYFNERYSFNSKPYCSIHNLTAGKYRFRFNYLRFAKIKTTCKNFYLVKPVETNPHAVEINGIQFETVVPEKPLIIPHKESKADSVQIGMKIVNNTKTAFRFDFYGTLIPQLIKPNGEAFYKLGGSNQLRASTESDYPLAIPGESVTFLPNAKLLWFKDEQLILRMDTGDGGFYYFSHLQPGEYLIRFVYSKYNNSLKMRDRKTTYIKPLQWFDKTIIATPYVKFNLSS